MRFRFLVLVAATAMFWGCAVDGEDVYTSYDIDPDFQSHTDTIEMDPRDPLSVACIYENNAIHICLTPEVIVNSIWYLQSDGRKIRYGTEDCQTLSSSGEYLLECEYDEDPADITNPFTVKSIKFELEFCRTFVEVIQAFEPNGDGQYEEWGVFYDGVSWGTISVENESGQKVYSSEDFNETWDGTYEGSPAPSGSYSYLVRGAYKSGFLFEFRGNLQLVR